MLRVCKNTIYFTNNKRLNQQIIILAKKQIKSIFLRLKLNKVAFHR